MILRVIYFILMSVFSEIRSVYTDLLLLLLIHLFVIINITVVVVVCLLFSVKHGDFSSLCLYGLLVVDDGQR